MCFGDRAKCAQPMEIGESVAAVWKCVDNECFRQCLLALRLFTPTPTFELAAIYYIGILLFL